MTSILWFKQQQIFKFKRAEICRKMMELKFLVKFTSTHCVLKHLTIKIYVIICCNEGNFRWQSVNGDNGVYDALQAYKGVDVFYALETG